MKKIETIAGYFAAISPEARAALNTLRKTIRAVVPDATEVISYGMPAFKQGRLIVAYGAFSDHCSFFPMSSRLVQKFSRELSGFDTSKGTIRFPFDKQLPAPVVKKMVKARMKENEARDLLKRQKKGKKNSAKGIR